MHNGLAIGISSDSNESAKRVGQLCPTHISYEAIFSFYKRYFIMARECKAGNWLFRIDPKDEKKLQRAPVGSSSYSHLWSAPNGERILDVTSRGEDVVIETTRHTYIRNKNGNVSSK